MKSIIRFVLGVLGSLLLTAGFARSAAVLDPVARAANAAQPGEHLRPAPNCTSECTFSGGRE